MKRSRATARPLAAAIIIALTWIVAVGARSTSQSAPSAGSLAIALPEGEGKRLVERSCGGCHDPSLVIFTREDEEGWGVIVNDMAARGAKGTPEELRVMTTYLAAHFNREKKFAPFQNLGALPGGATDERQLFSAGKTVYQTLCVTCHQSDGRGRDKVAPPLVGSDLTLGPAAIPVRIMLHGKRGPANVMPALGSLLTDEQIASVLTYVRREWGQAAPPIVPAAVKEIRTATAGRARPWTAEELLQLAAQPGKGEGNE